MGVQPLPYEMRIKKIEALSKIFAKGKIQLPSIVRKSLNLADGEKIIWVMQDGRWYVEKA